jgi:hypothetical protein
MQHHHLHHIETLTLSGIKVFLRITATAFAEQQPTRVSQPEKGSAIFRPEISAVMTYPETLKRLSHQPNSQAAKNKYE